MAETYQEFGPPPQIVRTTVLGYAFLLVVLVILIATGAFSQFKLNELAFAGGTFLILALGLLIQAGFIQARYRLYSDRVEKLSLFDSRTILRSEIRDFTMRDFGSSYPFTQGRLYTVHGNGQKLRIFDMNFALEDLTATLNSWSGFPLMDGVI